MDTSDTLQRLHHHQRLALDVVSRASAAGDARRDAERPALRAEMTEVLRDYQIFKHEEVFDPAVTSGSAEREALGRAMKIECIAAGEAFRMHLQRWKEDAITADPANYRAESHLTLNALRRHIEQEREGITRLLELLEADRRGASPQG